MIDGKRLKQLREEHHYSAKKLGEILGYSEATVYRWEKENSLRDIDIVNKLAELYNVTVSFILGKETTNEEVLKETAFANAVAEEPEQEEIAPVEETAGTEEKAAKKQLSLVKIGAITAASTFTLFAIVTAIIILCVYFQPKSYNNSTLSFAFSSLDIIIIIGIIILGTLFVATATIITCYLIRKRRKEK